MTKDEVRELIYEVLFAEGVQLQGADTGAGVTAEGRGRTLFGEGDQSPDETDEAALSAEDVAGVPLATGFSPGRPMPVLMTADGFDTFDRRGESTGTIDKSEAARRLREILTEAQSNRPDPDESEVSGGALRPADYRGIPIARGF